ncbi:unnamed protein product [Spodoptera littoralis]|uniref:Uncharacterized protein n=1 Tax=Spodoptera littoralis TaxID=7109 RepID=A0A9P0HY74_SPOLI|nr:unnamed protein product [Spodoptera littoralis]CAH1635982.1 unnamed protein product [Spodoptera littoralis]
MNTYPIIFVFVLFFVSSKMRTTKQYRPYLEKYPLYNCDKKKHCTKGGDKVCAINYDTNIIVEFPDKCTYYGANCARHGDYWSLEDQDNCKPAIIFVTKIRLTNREYYLTKSPSSDNTTTKPRARAKHNVFNIQKYTEI